MYGDKLKYGGWLMWMLINVNYVEEFLFMYYVYILCSYVYFNVGDLCES